MTLSVKTTLSSHVTTLSSHVTTLSSHVTTLSNHVITLTSHVTTLSRHVTTDLFLSSLEAFFPARRRPCVTFDPIQR